MSNRSLDLEHGKPGAEPAGDQLADTAHAVSGTSLVASDASFEALLREVASAGAPAPAPPLPQTGEVLAGKYRIEEKLGQGGMGAVFRATHVVSQKQVAIKWMLRSASNENARSRFVREARAAARIDHPNVVDVYDIGQDGDRGLYLVMQLLRGESLGQRIGRGPLAIAETVDLLIPAMRGVAAVHAAGVIHRDLKPDNIFLCEPRHGERRDSKVLDFGISAVASREGEDATLTRDGAILGTPAYMSPEQIQDSRTVDARADVYAFGVILYEALTGKLPFSSDSHHGMVLAIVMGQAKDPRQLRAELPAGLSKIVLRALEKDRDQRYADVDSLIQALAPYGSLRDSASGLPAMPAPTSAGRSRLRAGAIVLAVCAALLGLYLLSRPTGVANTPVPGASDKQRAASEPPLDPPTSIAPSSQVAPASALSAAAAVPEFVVAPAVAAPQAADAPSPQDVAPSAPSIAPASAGNKARAAKPVHTRQNNINPPKAAGARSGKIAIEDL